MSYLHGWSLALLCSDCGYTLGVHSLKTLNF
ncbi:hypothetical protein T4D_264 [Trichinella pseudospiralis]|uniref:Uncharacterized protein n=1 Tax=Trichinella pseudospiralis TaxID=6337 RepID=A0A0V1DRV6_TRIPS|nr:hypothetical protein T4D_264 [Trichinella pseudospiralis]